MRTTDLDPNHAFDSVQGRKSTKLAGSKGMIWRDAQTESVGQIRDMTVGGALVFTDNDDGTGLLTLGTLGGGSTGGALTVQEALLASDIALDTTVYGDDGPSLDLLAGSYLLIWRALYIVGGNTSVFAVVWNSGETVIYDEAEDTGGVSGYRYGFGGTGFASLATTTTVKISFSRSNDNTATLLKSGGNGTDRMTKLVAVKLG